MKKPEKLKNWKGYKGTWAASANIFKQKAHKQERKPNRPIPIRTKGTDKVTSKEKYFSQKAVKQFNKAINESENVIQPRKLNIAKPS